MVVSCRPSLSVRGRGGLHLVQHGVRDVAALLRGRGNLGQLLDE